GSSTRRSRPTPSSRVRSRWPGATSTRTPTRSGGSRASRTPRRSGSCARPPPDADGVEVGLGAFAVLVVAVLVGAAIQGAIGFGMNLVSVPVFAIVAPETLPVAVIVLGTSISISMFRHERADVDRTGLAWIIGGRVPGSVLGAWFVAVASTQDLRVAVASFVMAIALVSAAAPAVPVSPFTQLTAGVVSGVTGTTAGIGGPPVALLYQRHRGPT